VATIVEHSEVAESQGGHGPRAAKELEQARVRVDAYLRAWNLPEALREELAVVTMASVENRLAENPELDPLRGAIDDVERFLHARLNEALGNALTPAEQGICESDRLAMFVGGVVEKWSRGDPQSAISNTHTEATARLALQPQRPAETSPQSMHTSLSRLPSLRMIGGWFLLIVVIVLAFIFTR
jgi:hypothetical protein